MTWIMGGTLRALTAPLEKEVGSPPSDNLLVANRLLINPLKKVEEMAANIHAIQHVTYDMRLRQDDNTCDDYPLLKLR